MSIHLRGVGGAPGIALGYAARSFPERASWGQAEADPEVTLRRFASAQAQAASELRALAAQLRAEGREEEAGIFDAQSLLAEDPYLADEVARRVRAGPSAIEPALAATVAEMRAALAALDDPYLRDRASDMDSVGQAVLAALRGAQRALGHLPAGAVVLADDLTPA
ncbi:MAG TPA: phosphoenolpyruvate-utilizing N-terminal domain-containing protein, partial [Roseiflexaceae bacterium]|nr:phosphoenolpyruvate-utilizing N-terminal domain-containing protein [Roseiflexaceae bacterium]